MIKLKNKIRNEVISKKKEIEKNEEDIADFLVAPIYRYYDNDLGKKKVIKFLLNIFGIQLYSEFSLPQKKSKTLILAPYKRNQKKFWKKYIEKLNLEKADISYFNLDKKKYKLKLLTKQQFNQSINIQNKYFKTKNLFSKIFILSEIIYQLKLKEYYENINPKLKDYEYFYTLGDYNFPNIIFTKYFNNHKKNTHTFQFFNLSEDKEFKIEQEAFWINSQVNTIYVWGVEYKEFLSKKLPKTNIDVIGHPLYETSSKENIRKIEEKKIAICLNPPEKKNINFEMIKLVKNYCMKNNIDYYIKLHPIDKIKDYKKHIKHKNFKGEIKAFNYNCIWVVNNSTVYFDLIYNNKFVLRYKHKDSFLNLIPENKDFFSNEKELNSLVERFSIKAEEKKKKRTLKKIFNL